MKNPFSVLALTVVLSACGEKPAQESSEKAAPQAEVAQSATKEGAIADYMALKDAFVQTAVDAAKEAATNLVESLKAEDMDEATINAASMIMTSDDIETQRAAFKTITDNMVSKIKESGSEAGVYVQYCPMAFGNTGASWLSLSEDIKNPYFGDKMLTCGKVEEKL
ncbi:MAG: DUF3347 domain-containing protein [Cyclobacteriaceae bacterium]